MITSDGEEENYKVNQKLLDNLYRIRNRLFFLYSFFQGRISIPSLKYVELLRDKFDSCNIFDINPNLRVTVNSLVDEFHSIIENYEENFKDPRVSVRAIYIQDTLFDIYKQSYIIINKLDMLDELKLED